MSFPPQNKGYVEIMQIFDRYIFKSLFIATCFTAVTLAGIILLTQSLRFLELIINAGASGTTFWILTMMALPRFMEIILPVALMAATIFVYNRMTLDSEITVMRATGAPPMRLARPSIIMAILTMIALLFITMWLAPVSQRGLNELRQVIKAQYSTLLFREGVFNSIGPGLTVFIRSRAGDGTLRGVMIHDSRPENKSPVTVLAKGGVVVATNTGQQVVVYDGSRQTLNPDTKALERLNFERYTIDLPENSSPISERWREPDERTFLELFRPDQSNQRDADSGRAFMLEINRRITSPLLAPAYTALVLAFLLLGSTNRRGQSGRVIIAIGTCVLIQALYLAASSLSRQSNWGIVLMYALTLLPLAGSLFLLSSRADSLRQTLFFWRRKQAGAPA